MASNRPDAAHRTIGNESLALAFDERGLLASLQNRVTGCEYVEVPGTDFWQMICPGDDDPETPIRSAQQDPPEFVREGELLTVRYPDLLDFTGRRLDVTFSFTVQARGDELIFAAEIGNRGPADINELWFPMAGGLRSLGGPTQDAFLLYPESAGRRVIDPLHTLGDRSAGPVRGARMISLRELYPGRAAMQWMGFYGGRGSLYVASHDTSLQTTAVNAMLVPGKIPEADSISLGFIKYPFCKPGQSWRSEPFVVAVHHQTWHADARRYRTFADTWQDHRRTKPQWVQQMPAMHDIVMLHQHGRVRFSYDQIGEICDAAKAGGIDVVKLTGWSDGGHDNKYPDFFPSPRLGGENKLVESIRSARERGFRVVLYFHFIQMTPNSEFYARHGEFCAIKGPHGFPFIDVFTWPSHGSIIAMNERFQLINACTGTEPWKRQILDCVRRGLDWGADCIFLDQAAGAPSSFLCFDARHGHRSPAYAAGPGKTELSRQAREMVRAAGNDVALGAEYICDVILQFYDFTIPFGVGFFYGGQNFGEMYRCTFPEDVLLTQYMSYENYEQLAYSFVMGYRFFLAPMQQCELLTALKPEFVERLAALIALRRKHGKVLLEGQFLDTLPLQVGNPALVARAYQSAGAAAVAVWNPTGSPQPLDVAWNGRKLILVETPQTPVQIPSTLPAGEVAVMTFE